MQHWQTTLGNSSKEVGKGKEKAKDDEQDDSPGLPTWISLGSKSKDHTTRPEKVTNGLYSCGVQIDCASFSEEWELFVEFTPVNALNDQQTIMYDSNPIVVTTSASGEASSAAIPLSNTASYQNPINE